MVDQELLQAISDMLDQKLEEKLDKKLEEKLDKKLEEKLAPIRIAIQELDRKVSDTYELALEAWGTGVENRKWLEGSSKVMRQG